MLHMFGPVKVDYFCPQLHCLESRITSAFAPIITLLPILILPITFAPQAIKPLFPISGNPGYLQPSQNLLLLAGIL